MPEVPPVTKATFEWAEKGSQLQRQQRQTLAWLCTPSELLLRWPPTFPLRQSCLNGDSIRREAAQKELDGPTLLASY